MKRLYLGFSFATLAVFLANPSYSQSGYASLANGYELLNLPFPYVANGVEVKQVLNDISEIAGSPLVVSETVSGRVTIDNSVGTVAETLTAISTQVPIIWWYDGAALRVESRNSVASKTIPTSHMQPSILISELKALEVYDERFPLKFTSSGAFVRVVGPAGYTELISETIAVIQQNRIQKICTRDNENTPVEISRAGLPLIVRGKTN